jgi:hypothetical protein
MMRNFRLASVVIVAILVGCPALAQQRDSQMTDTTETLPLDRKPLADVLSTFAQPGDGSSVISARADRPRPVVDVKFALLGAGLVTAMSLDTASTFRARAWCPSCREDNPYAAPFVRRGPTFAYTAGVLFDGAVMGVSARMRSSGNAAVRRIWWLPPTLLIVGHGFAIRHNYALRESCRGAARCGW